MSVQHGQNAGEGGGSGIQIKGNLDMITTQQLKPTSCLTMDRRLDKERTSRTHGHNDDGDINVRSVIIIGWKIRTHGHNHIKEESKMVTSPSQSNLTPDN